MSIGYDANGNTLSDPSGKSYSWDFENRLTQAVNPGVGTTNFRYDPFGRRIQKSGPLGTTNYLYDGPNLIEEVDGSENIGARYTQGVRIDEPISELRVGVNSYYQQDGIGSISSLTNGVGAVANSYTFNSFGEKATYGGTLVNPFQYTGREFDSETGLYYYRARYYDPSPGRFLSEDPTGFSGGINKYAYVMNMPVNWIDPNGLAMTSAQCIELFKDIQRRVEILEEKMSNYDPVADGMGGATYQAGGVIRKTVPGSHFAQIVGMQGKLWIDIAKYQKECGNGPSIPCEVFKTVSRKIQEPVYPRTLFELQLDEESARYMEQFWRDILFGDVSLGAIGTGGALGAFEGGGAGLLAPAAVQ